MKYFLCTLLILAVFQAEYVKVNGAEKGKKGDKGEKGKKKNTDEGYEADCSSGSGSSRKGLRSAPPEPTGTESGYEGDESEVEPCARNAIEYNVVVRSAHKDVYIDDYGEPYDLRDAAADAKQARQGGKLVNYLLLKFYAETDGRAK